MTKRDGNASDPLHKQAAAMPQDELAAGLSGQPESIQPQTLLAQVLDRANLQRAVKQVRQNKGAPGIDGMTVDELPKYLRDHWLEIRAQLEAGKYQPQPVKRVEIPKPDGKTRPLGIPTVLDRFIQQAIAQVISAQWEPHFHRHSYGFRPRRSAHQAVREVQANIRAGYGWVVDTDLQSFFDQVNHDRLMARLKTRCSDAVLLRLVNRYLKAGVNVAGTVEATTMGVPQGGPLGPWTQKVTSSLNEKSHCVVLKRYLTYVVSGNILMTNEPIHALRKGSAFERCLRSDRPRLQPHRGRRGFGGAVRSIAAPSISLPARGAEHQASGGNIRVHDSDYDQGSRRGGGQAAGLCTGQRINDRGDGGARRVALSRQGKPAWLTAASEAINCIWSTFLTVCWQRSWSRCMPCWSRTMRAV